MIVHQNLTSGSESGERWAPGWADGVHPLWTDTQKEQEGGEAKPCPSKTEKTTFSSFLKSRRPSTYTGKLSGDQKGGDQFIGSNVKLPHRPLHWNSSRLRHARIHIRGR